MYKVTGSCMFDHCNNVSFFPDLNSETGLGLGDEEENRVGGCKGTVISTRTM